MIDYKMKRKKTTTYRTTEFGSPESFLKSLSTFSHNNELLKILQ